MERCCQSLHFLNSSVDLNILQESMTVITCFEMPLGFLDVDGIKALLIFCKCASLLLVTAVSIHLSRTQFMKGPAITN